MTRQPHEIVIMTSRHNTRRQFYEVRFQGERLLVHYDPEFAACRELLRQGFTGPLTVRYAWTEFPLILDIKKHARKRTFEPDAGRLRIGKWVEFKGREDPEAEAA